MSNAKTDAALYLLTGLLQRLDAERPGMIEEMIAGIESDRAAIAENIANRAHIDEVFDAALGLLNHAHIAP